jgi:hypothetical protein
MWVHVDGEDVLWVSATWKRLSEIKHVRWWSDPRTCCLYPFPSSAPLCIHDQS